MFCLLNNFDKIKSLSLMANEKKPNIKTKQSHSSKENKKINAESLHHPDPQH